jgi:hypothetical protein
MNKKRVKEDMVAGPYNPNRILSFGDQIEAELGKYLQRGQLSPVVYNKALDLMRRIEGQLISIYSRDRHGLATAVSFLIKRCS